MSAPGPPASSALLNARYIAIRTAEARGLTDRLLEAARDRTPGVKRLIAPMIYRYWFRNREEGWDLLERIGAGAVRFPGLVDREALEIFGEVSMPIVNACRQEPDQLARLGTIWQARMTALFGSPLARVGRLLARRWLLRAGANALGELMKRQPAYQLVNYRELEVTFGRPEAFRSLWRDALDSLARPEAGPGPVVRILKDATLPFDLYLMLICERALVYHGARGDVGASIEVLADLFRHGCPWFRQSVLYVLFHVLSVQPAVEDGWLARYDALVTEFVVSGSWRLQTSAGSYDFSAAVANSDVVAFRHRPDEPPRVLPALLERAVADGDAAGIASLFKAIDGVGFYHNNGALALDLIRRAYELGGKAVEERVVASLATVRLQNQPLVDAFVTQHRSFAGISPDYVAAVEPSVGEEDLATMVDGFVIHMMLTSDRFRTNLAAAFGRALEVRTVEEFFVQLLEWVRDELGELPR